ncbi:hrp65 protein-like isoform X2 [Toxorhynchites rutilus septentrionalis]|uniref:hrp65 protein-like isoform X2 n=1 Tax=Toxorhynchites rutilus septentrionalis TaxID=329112 RepID=UPI002478FC0D|nr:hrp65 protein-like isoform X2 [Toxorhynchites rutilus septentrionalis]
MEVAKPEVNGTPLPQRQQNNANQGPQPGGAAPANQNQGGGPQNQPGGGNKPNQNMNNRNNNQNKNRGNMNRFGNRNNQQQGGNRQNNQDGNNEGNQQQQHQQRPGNQGHQGNRGGNRNRNQGGDGDQGQGFDRRRSGPGDQYFINEKLRMLQGPLMEIPPIETEEVKFSGRNRLYIGNLTNDVTEDELTELFRPYGDISEIFMNKEKNYAFVRVDYFSNAEKAKRELDGTSRKNRILRVRFAPNATAIRVRNLTPFISNELLYKAFEVFGPLERASVQIDERGKSTGEGIVEFKNKPGAMSALRYCTEKCYFLCSSLRPCIVEPYTYQDDTDGLPEKSLNKKIPDFQKSRQLGPRFAEHGSFEHEYGQRWKHMHELYKQKAEALKREMIMEEEKLEAQMEFARYEHETEQLREQLRMREQDRDRQKAEWEMKERQASEAKQRNEIQMKHDVEEMQNRIKRTDDELHRRQQENNLFMQNQQMHLQDNDNNRRPFDMMNQGGGGGGGAGGNNFGGMAMSRNFFQRKSSRKVF